MGADKDAARVSVGLGVGLLLLVVLVALVFVVPWLTPDPDATNYAEKLAAPSLIHPFGTDHAGRDVLARLAAGARISLGAAILVSVVTLLLGLVVGLAATLVGGALETMTFRVVDVALAVPHLVLALAIVGVLGPGLRNLIVAMMVAGWAPFARYARTFARAGLDRPYVLAAQLAGAGRWRVASRHVVPPTVLRLLAVATLGVGEVVLGLSALSFLGLGVAPPVAEWGQMVTESRTYAAQAPWLIVVPGVAVVCTVTCASLLGDALEEHLDARSRG
ncbi:ABC transporter permease [Actinopolymorpha pittospori]|uniref:ABC-type dipeptide/oligopeptide/nickel transport system permease subunit n=1 Tax=Actinopolymorpha pittospori TaxID=648752 RepID=A0A927RHG2_9ACTN|nr:ABC transporter permease subunit [Actinopolymorpha pittospori]MBE1603423.1 ABC-type dipeptide/oligopeptide/nickel transport system permease subunit [Actinopolymorpha pittospori]